MRRRGSPARLSARRGRGWARVALALAAAGTLLGTDGSASAYCLTTACGEDVARSLCSPPHEDDCGEPLRWRKRCTGFSVHEDGSRSISANRTNDLVRVAFETWMNADCGDGDHPGIVIQDLGRVACDALEYNADRGNANIVVYRENEWPHPASSAHNVALTTTTFDPVTGELFDADIEINAANFDLTTGDDDVEYDLEGILTHEAGHFLGLGHSDNVEATMYEAYLEGDTRLRDLDPDDVAAVCDLYPPKRGLDETCNPLPRHGFSPDCADLQTEGDCAMANAPHPEGGGDAFWLGLAVAAAARRARRSRCR
jgi:hypothetical protein